MDRKFKERIEKIICLLPEKNIIIFESIPDFSDNSRAVFDEMLRQGINKKYRLIWCCHTATVLPPELQGAENVECVSVHSLRYRYYLSFCAKAFVISNNFLSKRSERQYYLYVTHGAAFKGIKDHRYKVPEGCYGCDFVTFSEYMGHYDAKNLLADGKVKLLPVGYARNDVLFHPPVDLHRIFPSFTFDQAVYWLPTFRQKITYDIEKTKQYTETTIPIIHDPKAAEGVNACAKKNGILLIVKPHPLQDISLINTEGYSNIVFIDNTFLEASGVKNYEVMGACDALLTDYSSVYYDYLLCDKPIGLCWEDFEEYRENEGFIIDPDEVMGGGKKLYTEQDLCQFLQALKDGEDSLSEERQNIKNKVHQYADGDAASRTVAHILNRIEG
ncbi:MAG: CDP-glycerol glycerophosphotransferase family protein [Eubacterium sp.]|nr:CDP-glycerol glycerophosphotransferase family protein [Eubacterium sp.]